MTMKTTKTIVTGILGITFFSSSILVQAGCCGSNNTPQKKQAPTTNEGGCCGGKTDPSDEPAKKENEGGCCGDKIAASDKSTPKETKPEATKTSPASNALEGYISVSTALYQDNLATAKSAAASIAKHNSKSTLAASAKQLSQAENIAEARSIFNTLSAAAIKAAKNKKNWKVAHCPMANGNKGGNWLQKSTDKTVNNPYFGAAMPHCGGFK